MLSLLLLLLLQCDLRGDASVAVVDDCLLVGVCLTNDWLANEAEGVGWLADWLGRALTTGLGNVSKAPGFASLCTAMLLLFERGSALGLCRVTSISALSPDNRGRLNSSLKSGITPARSESETGHVSDNCELVSSLWAKNDLSLLYT